MRSLRGQNVLRGQVGQRHFVDTGFDAIRSAKSRPFSVAGQPGGMALRVAGEFAVVLGADTEFDAEGRCVLRVHVAAGRVACEDVAAANGAEFYH